MADAFDAITSDRPYRSAQSQTEALEELRRNAGRQFDPRCVDALEKFLIRLRAAVRGSKRPSALEPPLAVDLLRPE